jgi:hypothetical protein
MRTLKGSGYVAIAFFCLIGTTNAQQINTVAPLQPGGLTIGGPGAVQAGSGDSVFFWASTTPKDVCVTVVNFGNVFVAVQLSSANFTPANVGRTIAVCASNTTNITATCGTASGGQCKFLWRVDKAQ